MAEDETQPPIEESIDDKIFIVVGVHLRAEVGDRPLAYELRDQIERWKSEHAEVLTDPLEPVVLSDVWYLNQEDLQRRPTICIGGPGVNALSAFFAQQLPEDSEIDEQQVVIQIDPDFTDLRVCIWGTNHELTHQGVELFAQQYLEGFLRAAATQVEPEEG
ncbi:MAG: hypothetical protein ACOC1G_00455 [Phycisphaeraceae bacterium]